jgi:hypothetical protein
MAKESPGIFPVFSLFSKGKACRVPFEELDWNFHLAFTSLKDNQARARISRFDKP